MSHKLLRSLIAKETEYRNLDREIVSALWVSAKYRREAREVRKEKEKLNIEIEQLRREISKKPVAKSL